jgi:hypothetical protein
MHDHSSLALRAQSERVRAIAALCEQGHTPKQAWALIRWRQAREELRMREPGALRDLGEMRAQARRCHPQAVKYPELPELRSPSLWALCAAGALLATFVGIVLGVAVLIVMHVPKALGRLGF